MARQSYPGMVDHRVVLQRCSRQLQMEFNLTNGKSRELVKAVFNYLRDGDKVSSESYVSSEGPSLRLLTEQQMKVLELLVLGESNKEIARHMSLAEGTIKVHISALFTKLKVRNRVLAALVGNALLTAMRKEAIANLAAEKTTDMGGK